MPPPIAADFRRWLDETATTALPKSSIGKAVAYSRRHWDASIRFLDDSRLPLDNNLSERSLRAVAVGRNNYMFAGSDDGAERAGVLYSVVQSCKLNGVDPLVWLAWRRTRTTEDAAGRGSTSFSPPMEAPHRNDQAVVGVSIRRT